MLSYIKGAVFMYCFGSSLIIPTIQLVSSFIIIPVVKKTTKESYKAVKYILKSEDDYLLIDTK